MLLIFIEILISVMLKTPSSSITEIRCAPTEYGLLKFKLYDFGLRFNIRFFCSLLVHNVFIFDGTKLSGQSINPIIYTTRFLYNPVCCKLPCYYSHLNITEMLRRILKNR